MTNEMILSAKNAKEFFNNVVSVSDECRLHISCEGWKIVVVDPANILMGDFKLLVGCFEEYSAISEEIVVGLDVLQIKNIVNEINEDCIDVSFYFERDTEKGGNVYKLTLKYGIFTWILGCLPENNIRKHPRSDDIYKTISGNLYSFEVSTIDIQKAIKKAKSITDFVDFKLELLYNKFYRFSLHGKGDKDTFEALPRIDKVKTKEKIKFPVTSKHSLDYLSDVMPVIQAERIVVELGDDYPLVWSFPLCKHGGAKFMLGPRIESE